MGKSSPPPPDYTPLADASAESARIMGKLGDDQLAFAKQQYDRSQPLLERVANQQMAAQSEQMSQARDYYNYQQDTFRPVERGLVADAQRFNTDAYANELASKASADAGLAFGNVQAQNQRASRSMGANPNSGMYAGMQQASGLALAANRANAMTNARTQADQMGYARRLDAVGMGRGLAGASSAAYGGANQAGTMAVGGSKLHGQHGCCGQHVQRRVQYADVWTGKYPKQPVGDVRKLRKRQRCYDRCHSWRWSEDVHV